MMRWVEGRGQHVLSVRLAGRARRNVNRMWFGKLSKEDRCVDEHCVHVDVCVCVHANLTFSDRASMYISALAK